MNMKRNLLWLAVASLAAPVLGYADDQSGNYIELGVGIVDDDNGKLGEYGSQLDQEGTFAVGGLHYENGAGTGAMSWADLVSGPYNTTGSAGYTNAGNFKFEVYGSQSQKIEKFNALTPYFGTGDATELPEADLDVLACVPLWLKEPRMVLP